MYGSAPARMRIPGLKTARRSLRWLRAQLVPHARVLGYHRVASPDADPFELCVAPENFSAQLRVLREEGDLLGLLELAEAVRAGRVPRRALVVTFDDGYADNLHAALPVLEAARAPATIFVTTDLMGREPWWETLARWIAAAEAPPERLELPVGARRLAWDVSASRGRGAEPRPRILAAAHAALVAWPANERTAALEALRDALRVAPGVPGVWGLSREELTTLASASGIEIGAHGVSHAPLASRTPAEQRDEIRRCKRELEDLLGRPLRAFSYPHGALNDTTRALVREAGFTCACASGPDVASRESDPFALPRLWPPNCGASEFSRWLRYWAFA